MHASLEAKHVGIWIRVSTEDQVKDESPETHERRARYYAESKGWKVAEVYRLDAVSGKTVRDNPETRRMLEDVRSGRITGLIFSKLARLARNTRELLDFADTFREAGADLISLAESIDTSTPAGRLFYTMIAALSQWEREEIAARVAAAVPIRAKLGKPTGGQASFGYAWKDGRLVPDPAEAPVRALVYELFAEHKRKKTVARILNERGFRTRAAAEFSDTTVARLIQDPTAKGIRRANYTRSTNNKKAWQRKPESEWVLHEVEPIVPEALWETCNAILESRRKDAATRPAKRTAHLFAGFTFCRCGKKMYVPADTAKYVCQSCRNKIPTIDLDAIFHEQLKTFLFSDDEIGRYMERSDRGIKAKEELILHLEAERRKVTSTIDRLYDLYQSESIDKQGFAAKYFPLAERTRQLDDETPRAQAELDGMRVALLSHAEIVSGARDLYSRWPSLPFAEKRSIVEAIIDRIVIHDGEVEFNLFYAPTGPVGGDTPEDSGGAGGTSGNSSSPVTTQSGGNWATQPQGFIAATSWKRAGNSACRAAREITMRPVSRGSRSASSAARWNSGNSSRNKTP
jgi:site-specific DNA recombinase